MYKTKTALKWKKNHQDLLRLHYKKLARTFQTRYLFGGGRKKIFKKINLFTLLVEKQASQRDGECANNLDFHQGNSHIE